MRAQGGGGGLGAALGGGKDGMLDILVMENCFYGRQVCVTERGAAAPGLQSCCMPTG